MEIKSKKGIEKKEKGVEKKERNNNSNITFRINRKRKHKHYFC